MEELLQSILDTIGEGVIFQEASGVIKFANQAARRTFGIDGEEAQNCTSLHPEVPLVYEDGSPCPLEEYPSTITLRTGQALCHQIRGIAKPGRPVAWLSINTKPITCPGQKLPEAVVISFSDITERKRVEESLRTNADRYRDAASTQAGIIWEMDKNFVVTHLSGRVRETIGYTPQEIIGRNPVFIIKHEDRKRVSAAMTGLPQGRNQVTNFDYWCRHKDGRRIRIETSCVPFYAKDGAFLGSRGTHQDITEVYWARRRKDIILQLHKMSSESDAAISAMLCKVCAEFTDSPMAFFGLMEPDESAMIAHVWSPQAMAECRISDKPLRFPIETAGLWADPVRLRKSVIANDYADHLGKRGLPDGHVPITRYLGVPIIEGNKVIAVAGAANRTAEYGGRHVERLLLVLSIIADFLSIRRKEAALRESEEKYRVLFNTFPQGVTVSDHTGKIVESNAAAEILLGITASEHIKRHIDGPEWRIIRSDGTPMPVDEYASVRALKENKLVENVEMGLIKTDMDLAWINVSAAPLNLEKYGVVITYSDITERRIMEEKLKTSEDNYRLIAEYTSDSIWVMDTDFRFTYLSPSTEKLFGYSIGEWASLEWGAFVHPDSMDLVKSVFESLRQQPGKGGANAVIRVIHKNGLEMWVEFNATPVTGQAGDLAGFVGVTRNITERKQAEDELRQSLQTAADLVRAIPSGLFIYQYKPPDRLILLSSNPEAERLTGISEGEFKGREFNEIWLQARDAGITEKYLNVMRTGKTFETEDLYYQDRRLSGAYRIRAFALPGDLLAVAFEDITARKKAEARNLEQEKILTDILEDTLSGYWDWDIPNNTEYLSPSFKRMIGYEDHELPNSPESWQRLIFPEDLKGVTEAFDRHVKSHGSEPYYNEVRYRHKNGTTIWVICAGRVIEWAPDGAAIRMVGCHVDITERKRAEDALKASEANFRAFFASMQDMIVVGAPNGRVLYANEAIIDKLGYGLAEIDAMGILGVHPQDLRQEAEDVFAAMFRGERNSCSLPLQRKDGALVPVETRVSFGKWNGVDCVFSISKDLTAEQEAQHRFERLFRNNPALMALSTLPDRRFVDVNDAFLETLGYARAEVVGKSAGELGLFPDAKKQKTVSDRLAAEGRIAGLELKVRAKDGSLRDGLFSGEVIASHGHQHFLTVMIDITDRKLAEEALHVREERNRQILHSAMDGFWRLDAHMRLLEVNEAYCRMSGYNQEELMAMHVSDLEVKETPDEIAERARRIVESGSDRFVSRHRRKDGSLYDVEASIRYRPGKGSEEFAVFLRDITEQRRMEAQLRQAQRMEALGTLAGGIAHDFNNILGAVLGFAEIALEDSVAGNADPSDIKEIITAVQRAKELIKQILTFGRKNEPTLHPLSVNQACRKAQSILERTIPKMIAIECNLADGLPHISADQTQMEQVLLNLSSNAADAMPDGGRLVLATRAVKVNNGLHRLHPENPPGDYVLLTVSDTGLGMDRETREHIFEPFFTTKDVGKGTGLGLSTVYGIVKSHGGYIYCHSEPGQGTTFSIYLPVMAQEVFEGKTENKSEAQSERNADLTGIETILLVDDEDILRAVAGRILQGAGYRVLEAPSGEEALKAFAEQTSFPDLVITDLSMPGMGGHKAMRELFARYPGTKVVIASGYASQDQIKASLDAGAAAYVAKPFKKSELLSIVRQVLDSK